MNSIYQLPDRVNALPKASRFRFERIFDVEVVPGRCVVPDTLAEWAVERFGSVGAVEHQRVARVFNKITLDGALINPLRAKRPLPSVSVAHSNARDQQPPDEDMFARPLERTAADVFGRVRGAHCITTGNIARWDGQHAVLIFDEADPMAFTRPHLRDYFAASLEWARRANAADPAARFFVWMWNGGLGGGASIPHAHAQIALGRTRHYAHVERLRRDAARYRAEFGADYFDELRAAHDDVGLGFEANGLPAFVYLAALRGKDTWIFGRALDDQLADALHDALRALIERADMQAFDVGVLMPPLFGSDDDAADWRDFPVIARILGRVPIFSPSSDIGAGDLMAMSVIPDDPFAVKLSFGS